MDNIIRDITSQEYKYGFTTDVETDIVPAGLNEDIIRLISAKKGEPEWLLEFRLKAFRKWQTMSVPTWAHLDIPEIDFQAISYYAAPNVKAKANADIAICLIIVAFMISPSLSVLRYFRKSSTTGISTSGFTTGSSRDGSTSVRGVPATVSGTLILISDAS